MLPDYYEYAIQRARQRDIMRDIARYRLARSVTQNELRASTVRVASKQLVCRLPILGTAVCRMS